MPVQRVLGNTISSNLYRLGWSDGDLASRSGLSRLRVNRVKNRRTLPTVGEALAIAAALRRRVCEIFYFDAAPSTRAAEKRGRGARARSVRT